MRIGILTYFGDLNCGTNLQAYATMQALKSVFPNDEVEIIDYHGFKQKVKPYYTSATPHTLYNDLVKYLKYRDFWKNTLNVKNKRVIKNVDKALHYIRSKGFERIYIGADTLLELSRLKSDYDGLSSYWLSPDIKVDKYFISASCKNVVYEKLSERQKELMAKTLDDFKGYSVRDKVTELLFSHYIDKNRIVLSPDPTFVFEINYQFTDRYWTKYWKKLEGKKIICFHTLRGEQWPVEVAAKLKKEGYLIASLRTARWADIILNDLSPFEQLGVYRRFSCMITHRFHDTIFCLKNGTPVMVYAQSDKCTTNGDSKYRSLLDWFGLNNECMIDDRGSIKVDSMLMQIKHVINVFEEKKEEIASTCCKLGNLYMDYLKSTK